MSKTQILSVTADPRNIPGVTEITKVKLYTLQQMVKMKTVMVENGKHHSEQLDTLANGLKIILMSQYPTKVAVVPGNFEEIGPN